MEASVGFRIDNVAIDHPTVLAPMEGITDRDFRTLIRSLGGCGLTVTEFVSSEAMTRTVAKAWKMAEIDASEHPVSIQIYQSNRLLRRAGQSPLSSIAAELGWPGKRLRTGAVSTLD